MINKQKIIILALFFSIIFCITVYGEKLYSIERNSKNIKLLFDEYWCFSEIKIPVFSPSFWGDNLSHNIAVLEIGPDKHILSRNGNSDYLIFSESEQNTNKLTITSINSYSDPTPEQSLFFKAIHSQTKYIEDNLLLIVEKENKKINSNNCFSCHSLIPAAMAIKSAQTKGFSIDKTLINNLFISITNLQNNDGSFYFDSQPCYGKISTTLSTAYILALLSDNMPTTFITTGEKINDFLKTISPDNNSKVKADFIFEPFFNHETTSLLHEIIFQKYMYLKNNSQNQHCNERANNLLKQSNSHKNDPFIKKLLLLSGVPYSYQLPPDERTLIIKEIKNHLESPQNKTSEILRMLCLYVITKIAPYQKLPSPFYNSEYEENNVNNIWKCFEKILYNSPRYLNGSYDENQN